MGDRADHAWSWFQTWSGVRFFPAAPRPEDIHLEDIAHALANLCRFAGHVRTFYSVAQHSVLVSQLVPEHLALHGLLHDAAEAYVGDLIAPMKRELRRRSPTVEGSAFDEIERGVERAILERFGLPELSSSDAATVKYADLRALATERRDLLLDAGHVWESVEGVAPHPGMLTSLSPANARAKFLRRFEELAR